VFLSLAMAWARSSSGAIVIGVIVIPATPTAVRGRRAFEQLAALATKAGVGGRSLTVPRRSSRCESGHYPRGRSA
jgi:hypothetical protein